MKHMQADSTSFSPRKAKYYIQWNKSLDRISLMGCELSAIGSCWDLLWRAAIARTLILLILFFFLSTEINSPQYLIDRPHFCFLNSSDFSSKSEMLTVSVSC